MLNSAVLNGRVIRAGSSTELGVRLNGRFASIQPGTLNGTSESGARSTCRFTLVNPSPLPVEGETFDVRLWHELLFAGTLHEITQETNPTLTRSLFRCEALGWEHLLERHIMTATYESQAAGPILDDVVARHLVADGILRGTFEAGPTLTLAKGDDIRVSEFIRDVADAAGGFVLVTPEKMLSFVQSAEPPRPSLAGQQLWLDASDLAGADTDPIGTWTDKSGEGHDAVQAIASKKPLLKKAILNGRSIVRFDGSDDVLTGSGLSTGAGALTMIVVAKMFTQSSERRGVFAQGDNVIRGGLDLGSFHNGGIDQMNSSIPGIADLIASPPHVTGDWLVRVLTHQDRLYRYYEQGVLVATFTDSADLNLPGTFMVGLRYEGAAFAQCDVAEILRFNRSLLDAEREALEQYLQVKWGLYAGRRAPFTLNHDTVELITKTLDREDYRNQMTVRVRGTGGATVDVTRSDASQIAQRQAVEGGSGIYERFESIEHPVSNDPVQLTRLGIGYALTRLLLAGQSKLSLLARTRLPHLRVGQLLTVNLPAYGLSGTWTITRLRFWEEDGQHLLYEIEAALSSVANLALESLLRIVQAGRATVQLPASDFQNLQTFTTSGIFVVPGTGQVELQLVTYGAGAGGSSGGFTPLGAKFSGQPGGNGGKATTFRALPAGTILTITVGAGGAGGNVLPGGGRGPGTSGGLSKVESNGLLAQGDGGIGDTSTQHGGGQGDFVVVGGGTAGGAPGSDSDPQTGGDGQDGLVEIFY